MPYSYIDRSSQNDLSQSNESNQPQRKIDPVAQLKVLNDDRVRDWGLFDDPPAQLFARDEEEEKTQAKIGDEPLQKKAAHGSTGTATHLPGHVQAKMGSSFGTDFSGVNIHTNSGQATYMGALAYTQGNDVHFAPGQYNPGSQKGQELIGHELTHVVQQRQGRVAPTKQGKGLPVNDNPALEKEADEMGAKAAQGKMADVKKKGSGIQKKDLSEENEETTTIGYETFKSKTFKSSDNAKLYSLTESDDRISINDIYEKEKNYAIKSAIIPKNLKASILETDNSYNAKDNSYIEVVKIRIEDASNTEWNGRVVWTTKTNVSEIYEDEGFCKIVDSEANVRIDAVEVNGKQKTIPDETEITISEYRENNGKYYFKVSDKDTKEEYGWMKVDGFESNLENVSFGVSKAVYISEEENHSTINQNNTKTFEEDGYKYESIDENNDYIRISKGTKVKVISSDESYREVEQIDGAYIGWTSVLNIATKVDDEGFYEVTNDDARIRSKEKNYKVKSSTLSVGTLVIVKERISEAYSAGLYTKVALTEKKGDNYTEKADSDVWVLANSLTGKWADVKGKHATWEKGKYTGQIDLVNVMGTGKEMEYMKADTTNADNDMYGKYMEMADAAKSDGVIIGLVDGFRTYQEQKYLDDREDDPGFNPAATPGYSKHQIGIAIDLNNKDNGGDNDINRWMMKNSYKYGFVRPLKMGQSEGHHWEYRPSDARSPEEVEIDNKKYIHYYFATWSPDKKWDNSDNNKWYATYYEEVK